MVVVSASTRVRGRCERGQMCGTAAVDRIESIEEVGRIAGCGEADRYRTTSSFASNCTSAWRDLPAAFMCSGCDRCRPDACQFDTGEWWTPAAPPRSTTASMFLSAARPAAFNAF